MLTNITKEYIDGIQKGDFITTDANKTPQDYTLGEKVYLCKAKVNNDGIETFENQKTTTTKNSDNCQLILNMTMTRPISNDVSRSTVIIELEHACATCSTLKIIKPNKSPERLRS